MKYKLETVIEWVVMDGLWWAAAIAGTFYGHQHWFWTFAFLTWFLFIMWGLIAAVKIAAAVVGTPFKVEDPAVPKMVSAGTDFALACVMAYTGHFFYAGLVVAQMIFEQTYYEKVEVKTSVD
jgi:hypothetical protein